MAEERTVDLKSYLKNDSDTDDTNALFTTAPQTPAPPAASMSASAVPTRRNEVPRHETPSTADDILSEGPATPSNADTAANLVQQRTDIDRIAANVDKLLQEMKTVKASVDYIKFQQQTFADQDTAASSTELAEDLGNLTEKVTRVSTKVKEVDGLKVGLNTMEERVQRLEETIQSVQSQLKSTRSNLELNGSKKSKAVPSPIRSHTKQSPPHSDLEVTMDLSQEDGARDSLVDSLRRSLVQHVLETGMSLDKPTSRKDHGISRPLITSAEKVAALKRRRQSSSSSSSSSGTPPPMRHSKTPKIKGNPDWSTKPNTNFVNKGKVTSLNDHTKIAPSDPEDSDYGPNSQPQRPEMAGTTNISSRSRGKIPIRLPTPEWEKSDWEGPSYANGSNAGGRHVARRGTSGRASLPDRDAIRRRYSGYESCASLDDNDSATIDSFAARHRQGTSSNEARKIRDSQGRLLRPNGKVDGRSLRYQKEREAIAMLGAGHSRDSKGHHQLAREARERLETLERQKKGGNNSQQQTETTASQNKLVDPAALEAAGYVKPAVLPTASSNGHAETAEGPAKQIASDGAAHQVGNMTASREGAHEMLMKKVFPWR
ncbi:MAG: hypothetical protein Q9202_006070 [Teloschistes flavicans]